MGSRIGWFALGGLLSAGLLASLYLLPPVRDRLEWRVDAAGGGGGGGGAPGGGPPPPPLPSAVALAAPEWDKQDWNNCGPATLALGLRFYGWTGDQFDISDLLKPDRGDKNVNVEELVYYVRTRAGWLSAEYRVGGDIDLLRRFIAARFPALIAKGHTIAPGGGGR